MKTPKPIAHVDRLARALGLTEGKLRRLARKAGSYYSPCQMKIRGKERPIDRPVGELKHVQRRIYEVLLEPIELPSYVQGGVTGRSHLTNAARHAGSQRLGMTDVRSCFPSISNDRVFRIWLKTCGHGPDVASLLTKLTTYKGRLPQGAPTSVALANLALLPVDQRIRRNCPSGIVYSRYVDDLAVSGAQVTEALGIAVRSLSAEGFQVARDKTRVMGLGDRQQITGQTINAGRPSAPRWRDASIRSSIYRVRDADPNSDDYSQLILSIKGKIGNVRLTNPGRADCLAAYLDKTLSNCSTD